MIDSEYDHAADSLSSGIYVHPLSYRSLIPMKEKDPSVHDWEDIPSASADIFLRDIMRLFLGKR